MENSEINTMIEQNRAHLQKLYEIVAATMSEEQLIGLQLNVARK